MKPEDIERMNAFFDTNHLSHDETEYAGPDLDYDPEDGDAAGVAFFTEDGRLLLMLRRADAEHGGKWAFPAGGVEEGESPEGAARREFYEETGHRLEFLGGSVSFLDDDTGMRFTAFMAIGDEFTPVVDVEHTGYIWATPDNLPTPLHPGVVKVLKGLPTSAPDVQ